MKETHLNEIIQEATKSPEKSQEGFEMTSEQANQITVELSKLNDAILHDKPINIEDLEDLGKVAREIKIEIEGEVMTVEEAESIPDLKMNAEIWNEMRKGNFENINKLTRITPAVSRCLENFDGIMMNLNGLISPKGLILPQSVVGSLSLDGLASAEGLVLPQSVGGFLSLEGLVSAVGLVLPKVIRYGVHLDGLTLAKSLVLPQSIGGSLFLNNLISCDDLTLSQNIEGDLWLSCLTSAKGLVLPQHIGGGLYLEGLSSAEGLVLPQSIEGFISLDGLTIAEGLVLPEIIKVGISLGNLPPVEKEKLKQKYPQHKDKIQ